MVPDGDGTLHHYHGIAWFLNLAHSCGIFHSLDASADDDFKLYFPFGHELDGKLLGTPGFPAMKVRKDAHLVLPRQRDGCSCGFGIAAGIAIVLNSLLGQNAAEDNTVEPTLTNEGDIEGKGVHSCFSSTFEQENLEVHLKVDNDKEAVCYFPIEVFSPLPCADAHHLFTLKEEWLTIFDRVANLQHVVLPKRQEDEEYQVSLDYEFTKEKLKELDFLPCGKRPHIRSGSDVERWLKLLTR